MSYLEKEQQASDLLKEAAILSGQIHEVRAKTVLLKQRAQAEEEGGFLSEGFAYEMDQSLSRMKVELDTYSERMREIFVELKGVDEI